MPLEIERKFLVKNDDWRAGVTEVAHLRDGLIARFGGGKIRVRHAQQRAWITLKGPRAGMVRSEFEYEIPVEDAEEILRTLCDGPIIEKDRHCILHGGRTWSVDVHRGCLAGLILAEVELGSADDELDLPTWAGREVTHDPAYRKEALLRDVGE